MQNYVQCQPQVPQNVVPQQVVQQPNTVVQNVPQQTPTYTTQPVNTVQVPNYSGVNIQIFNPSVGTPGAAPVYNVNAPQYPNCCYPADYYTQNYGNPNNANTNNNGLNNANNEINNNTNTTETTKTTTVENNNKKTEKKEIVQLTDEYIKNLENYLNSQDKEIRFQAAQQVAERLEEDKSRKDDKALTALINKMLQDPSHQVRVIALSMLEARYITGDAYTVNVLKNMQQSEQSYGLDALTASNILLKMSGQIVEKEVEVRDKKVQQKEKDK